MRKRNKAILMAGMACMMAFGTVVSASASENLPVDENGDPSPFGKYEEPVTVEIVQSINPTISMPEGDTATDNYYTRYIKDNLNIDISVKWSAASADYNEKLNLAIASNDLPDVFTVNEQQFRKLLKSDMLEDLTPYFDTYTYDIIKQNIDSTDGKAMENITYNDKIYAVPNVQVEADGYNLMWIRQDWLDELGLEAPQTIEELEQVAQAFVDNNMGGENTIGILGPTINGALYNTFLSTNNLNCLDGIFQAYQSYPGFWVEDGEGNVVYGSTTQETKEALGELQKMYADGILDQELGVRKDADEAWKSGKAGILFSPWWHGYNVKDCIANDAEAEWKAYAAPLADDGNWYAKLGGVGNSYCVVRKGYEHPEAAIMLNNLLRKSEGTFQEETSLDSSYYPGRVVITPSDECSFSVKALRAKINGEEIPEYDPLNYKLLDSDLASLDECLEAPYDDLSIEKWKTENMSTSASFGRLYSLLMGMSAVVDAEDEGIVNKVYSTTYTQTDTMERKWTNLKKKEDETFLKIIIGEESLDAFDTFVEEWNAEGGEEITAEVQELANQ
ncbi:MAG: extracellular solute-binding protein [Eubacteriales bacterium]|nr:extracellular solute-binding protein [Eubacteriales bacterium]